MAQYFCLIRRLTFTISVHTQNSGAGVCKGCALRMFQGESSSSSEEGKPFNAIKAAAEAKRKIRPANPDDPVYKAITASLNNPAPQNDKPSAPKRESRYIGRLVEMAEQRKEEGARVAERRLLTKQREEDGLYDNKERFVTSAYRKKLKEDKIRDDRERSQEAKEEQRRSKGLGGFYGNLFSGGNVAMGGNVENAQKESVASTATHKKKREKPGISPREQTDGDVATNPDASKTRKRRRTRFGDAQGGVTAAESNAVSVLKKETETASQVQKRDSQRKSEHKKRGLRRNDEKSIEEYRRRYFERRAKRLAAMANG